MALTKAQRNPLRAKYGLSLKGPIPQAVYDAEYSEAMDKYEAREAAANAAINRTGPILPGWPRDQASRPCRN